MPTSPDVERFMARLWQPPVPSIELHTSDPTGEFTDWAHRHWSGTKRIVPILTLTVVRRGAIAGVVILSDWTGPNIFIHVASDGSSRWATRRLAQLAFFYPFVKLGCARITAAIAGSNGPARRLAEHARFSLEHEFPAILPAGDSVCVYSLARDRWLGMTVTERVDGSVHH